MGGVDHDHLVFGALNGQADHDPSEDAAFVAALEPVAIATHLQRFQRLKWVFASS
jgi:hypothetical protein